MVARYVVCVLPARLCLYAYSILEKNQSGVASLGKCVGRRLGAILVVTNPFYQSTGIGCNAEFSAFRYVRL